jgi:Ala-tRNA(Pro) deacylase
MSTKDFLQNRHVPFEVVSHAAAYDSQHLAQAVHTPGREVAKTVLLRANHGYHYVLAVLPATHQIDFAKLSEFLGQAEIGLATEAEIAQCCPDSEFGVLPPFGSHYNLETIVDETLTTDEYILFECDSHTEAIRMKYSEFYNVEHPLIARFARPAHN